MRICNSETLKNHFENLVDVKLFTPAEICTIIDTFTEEVPIKEMDLRPHPKAIGGTES